MEQFSASSKNRMGAVSQLQISIMFLGAKQKEEKCQELKACEHDGPGHCGPHLSGS